MKLIKEKKIYTGEGMIENGYIRFDEKIEEVGDMTGFEPKEDDLEVNCAGTMVVPVAVLLSPVPVTVVVPVPVVVVPLPFVTLTLVVRCTVGCWRRVKSSSARSMSIP